MRPLRCLRGADDADDLPDGRTAIAMKDARLALSNAAVDREISALPQAPTTELRRSWVRLVKLLALAVAVSSELNGRLTRT